MISRSPCSVLVFTLQEEIHLPSCLTSLGWCDDVILVDSYSTDGTLEVARRAGARIFQHEFTGFGDQRNWALENTQPKHEWVLILDADERVPAEMAEELRTVLPSVSDDVGAFRVARRFHWWGRWIRYSSLYPSYVVRLVRRGHVRYVNRGHAETQEVKGEVRALKSDLIDENLKGLEAWFARQNRYSSHDAAYELEQERAPWSPRNLFSADPLVRRAAAKRLAGAIPGRPLWYFIYTYVLRGGFRDGLGGLVFCLLRSNYQLMVAIKKYELRRMRLSL